MLKCKVEILYILTWNVNKSNPKMSRPTCNIHTTDMQAKTVIQTKYSKHLTKMDPSLLITANNLCTTVDTLPSSKRNSTCKTLHPIWRIKVQIFYTHFRVFQLLTHNLRVNWQYGGFTQMKRVCNAIIPVVGALNALFWKTSTNNITQCVADAMHIPLLPSPKK